MSEMFITDECPKCGRELKSNAWRMCGLDGCHAKGAFAFLPELERALNAAEYLRERAIEIARAHNTFVDEPEFARLIIVEHGVAELSWPEVETGYYNSASIESQRIKLPARLLVLSAEEFDAWKAEQDRKADAKKAHDLKVAAERKDIDDRATLAELKAKYEPK